MERAADERAVAVPDPQGGGPPGGEVARERAVGAGRVNAAEALAEALDDQGVAVDGQDRCGGEGHAAAEHGGGDEEGGCGDAGGVGREGRQGGEQERGVKGCAGGSSDGVGRQALPEGRRLEAGEGGGEAGGCEEPGVRKGGERECRRQRQEGPGEGKSGHAEGCRRAARELVGRAAVVGEDKDAVRCPGH